mgnify:CR=1 FL=1
MLYRLPFFLAVGCGSTDGVPEAEIQPIVGAVVDENAPALLSWSGAMDCCGEDPHPVHGAILSDGSVVMVGKAMADGGDTTGFVTRWMVPNAPPEGRYVDGNDNVILQTHSLPSGSVLAQAIEVNELVVVVGYSAASGSGPLQGIALAIDPETFDVLARFEISGPDNETSAALESVALLPSGALLFGGSWGVDRSEVEGLKSFGNIVGGRGLLVRLELEAWLGSEENVSGPSNIDATVHEVTEVQSVKSMRSLSDGSVAAVGHDDEERSGLVWIQPGLSGHHWMPFDDGFELSDLTIVPTSGGIEAAVLVGHGGASTIDGHAKLVTREGDIVWSKTFGNPGIPADDSPPIPPAADKFVFDECWGVVSSDTGVVVGCGTGIEGCDAVQASAEERNQCENDPRRSWRSHLVAISTEGEVLWSRTESFVDARGEAHETASEFVMMGDDGTLYSVVDQNFGVSLARYAH